MININLLPLILIKQNFSKKLTSYKKYCNVKSFSDIPEVISNELSSLKTKNKIKHGDSVAIAVGSRGITNLLLIVKSLVKELKLMGAKPFIVPAMGSHGGGTSEGQLKILSSYGITEKNMCCPIRATMNVMEIGKTKDNIPILLDKNAYNSNHIIIVNRVKPHTTISGIVESGLIKMCLIGLGKKKGAEIYHRMMMKFDWNDIVNTAGKMFLDKLNILFGLTILEDAYKQTKSIMMTLPEDFFEIEPKLLKVAQDLMPSIPFNEVDLLIVDKIGKDISGTGMDPNITGRKYNPYRNIVNQVSSKLNNAFCENIIQIKKIFVRDLSKKTNGNANGIGLADLTTQRLVNKINFESLYANAKTACRTDSCKIPMMFNSDKKAIETALDILGISSKEKAKIVWIKNTLDLEKIIVSESYLETIEKRNDLVVLKKNLTFDFDKEKNLKSLF